MDNLKRAFVALSAAMAAGKLAGEFTETAKAIDDLAKTSDRLGIATDNLAALRFAGEQTGVEVQTLDMALQRMVRRVAEAANGTGEAKDALAELGLNAAKLSRMSPDQAFKAIADAMSGIPSQADKVRLSFKLFDSEGVKLVNTLALGATGIHRLEEQAKSLGIAISREEAAKIEAFNDALNSLSNLIGGLKTEIVISIADDAKGFVESMQELILAGKELFRFSGKSSKYLASMLPKPGETVLLGSMHIPERPLLEDFFLEQMTRNQGPLYGHNMSSKELRRLRDQDFKEGLREREGRREQKVAPGPLNRRLANGIAGLVGPRGLTESLDKARGSFDALREKAFIAANKAQRGLFMEKLFGPKPQEEQAAPEFISRAINAPIIAGTVEAIASERVRERVNDIEQRQLKEGMKQTKLLEVIANKPVSMTELVGL